MTINIDTTLSIVFMLWLLILAVGYFIVEILEWKEYFWRKHLERYNNSLFDRIVHYTIWGILANIWVLLFEIYFNGTQIMLLETFNNSANISSGVIWNNIDRIWIQIFVFSIFYFLYLLAVICLFWGWKRIIKAISRIGKILVKKLKSKNSKQTTNKENSEKQLPEKEEKEIKKNILIGILSWSTVSISFLAWDLITKKWESLWLERWWVVGVFVGFLVLVILTNHLMKKKL